MPRSQEKNEISSVNKSLLQSEQLVVNNQLEHDTDNDLKVLGYLDSDIFKSVSTTVRDISSSLDLPTNAVVPYDIYRESTDR